MRQIDCYMTVVSPWTYLVGPRLEEIATRHGARVTYKPVDPPALFARTGGLMLGERHETRRAYRLQELARQSKKTGMPLNLQPAFFPTNPAPAAYAIIAAQEKARGSGSGDVGALVRHLCAACWTEDRNVAEDEVITDCLSRAGFSTGLAMSGMLIGAEIYSRNLEEAVAAGVFGFPFFVVEEQKFWGQDRLDDLDAWLGGGLH